MDSVMFAWFPPSGASTRIGREERRVMASETPRLRPRPFPDAGVHAARAAVAFVLAAVLIPNLAAGTPSSRDFRPLTDRESAMLFPLVCDHPSRPVPGARFDDRRVIHDRCAKLGSDLFERQIAGKILYGSFTSVGADEALVTYSDGQFGAPGIPGVGRAMLFARSNGHWKLAQLLDAPWSDCTEIPKTAPQGLLCLYGYTEQGIRHEWFSVQEFTPHGTKSATAPDRVLFHTTYQGFSVGLSKAEIEANEAGCPTAAVPKGKAYLVWLHALRSSNAAPYFAVAGATYETAEDIASACEGPHPRKVRQLTGQIRFRDVDGKVTVVTPVQFVL